MNIGDLNKRVTFSRQSSVRNEYGEKIDQWTNYKAVWGSINYISDGERFRAGQNSSKLLARVTIRNVKNHGISNSDRLSIGGIIFSIEGIKPVYNERFLEITVGTASK